MSIDMAKLKEQSMNFFTKNVLLNGEGIEASLAKATKALGPAIKEGTRLYEIFKEKTAPYTGLTQMFVGFGMMFFGGFFMTTIAVYEAINQSGAEQFYYNVNTLKDQAIKVNRANIEDNQRDDDNDGIADVLQITDAELARRKMFLFFKTADPVVVNDALHGLYLILLAVSATLRSSFARVISIGASIGDVIEKTFSKYALPQVLEQTPDEYKGWVKYAGLYFCRWIAVMIAFRIQTILSTVHSAYKGAREFTDGLNELAKSQGKEYLTEGYADEALAGFLAIAGVYMQLFFWQQLPGVVKLIFFPAFFLESILRTLVSSTLTNKTT